ncbi:hypothetical protein [Vibrio harveyi]|uniref:hypothetical protein n=1 Tax=Vibrio harveyi TaxID=669 RepID=UPI0024805FDA|nr:hypothetical protein [Vibrio harveyi]
MSNRQRLRREMEVKEWLDSLPKHTKLYVKVFGIPFRKPRWWNDQIKISALIGILKFITLCCYVMSFVLLLFSLTQNVKNKDWQLYTFDQNGNVEWIKELKKLN